MTEKFPNTRQFVGLKRESRSTGRQRQNYYFFALYAASSRFIKSFYDFIISHGQPICQVRETALKSDTVFVILTV
ncbi:hypothetical protein D3OALGA1CA_2630 [Olavius algarvensis associated proteobacterium Delta 3]|nr:hypothetical protein D3OALGA1CA_2630 [Olavius algarvensis associated proteobacterium Delta 3]